MGFFPEWQQRGKVTRNNYLRLVPSQTLKIGWHAGIKKYFTFGLLSAQQANHLRKGTDYLTPSTTPWQEYNTNGCTAGHWALGKECSHALQPNDMHRHTNAGLAFRSPVPAAYLTFPATQKVEKT